MKYYARRNQDPYKCSINDFNLHKVNWHSEYEKLYPNVIPTLEALLKKYKLGIIANQPRGLIERLINYKIRDYFEVIILR